MNQKRLVHNNWWIEPVVPLQQANRDSQKGLYYGTNQLVEQSLEHKRAIAELRQLHEQNWELFRPGWTGLNNWSFKPVRILWGKQQPFRRAFKRLSFSHRSDFRSGCPWGNAGVVLSWFPNLRTCNLPKPPRLRLRLPGYQLFIIVDY